MAVVYARYSSHSQGEQSIEGQLSEAHRYAEAHGYTIVHEYVDRAQSGRTDNRAAFQQMLRDTAKKQFDVIICWKVDRFGRNREEIAINKMRCRKNGVRVEYVAEKIPDTPEGVVLEAVLEGFAEYYSLQLSQNVRRGLAESAEKCQSTGGNRPLGYKTGPDKKFVVDEDTAPTVRKVFAMYAQGATVSEIVRALNAQGLRTKRGTPFTQNSLHAMLKNEKYIGVYTYDGRRIENGVPRIVDDETFYKVQEMLKVNKRAPAKTWSRADYLLSDKLFCGKCGSPMVGESGTSKTGARHNYYICTKKKRLKGCDKKAVRQADIETEVLETVHDLLEDTDLLNSIIDRVWDFYQEQNQPTEEQHLLQQQLKQTESGIQNLLKALEAGAPGDIITRRLHELSAQKEELKAALADLELSAGFHLTKERLTYFLYKLRGGDLNDRRVQQKLIDTFVNAVFVFDDRVTITFNYSGGNNTITLPELQSVEEFVHHATCSTKAHRYELFIWKGVFALTKPPSQ